MAMMMLIAIAESRIPSPSPPFTLAADSEKVGADALNRSLGFEGPCRLEDVLSQAVVDPPDVEVREDPRRTLDAEHGHTSEAGALELAVEILGPVKVRRREVFGMVRLVAMLTVDEIPIADAHELRVARQLAGQAVERGCIPRNGGNDDDTRRCQYTKRFAQRDVAIG